MSNISSTRYACQMAKYMTTVVGDQAYIVGGYNVMCNGTAATCNDTTNILIANNDILQIDFSESFTWDSSNVGVRLRVPYKVPAVKWASLWAVAGRIYEFGGEWITYGRQTETGGAVTLDRPPVSGGVWEYDIATNQWSNITTKTEWDGTVGAIKDGATACDRDNICYVLEGTTETPSVQGSLLSYSIERQTWLDMSDIEISIGTVLLGRMMYIDSLGEAGVLVVVGGTTEDDSAGRPMDTINVFDIGTRRWFAQKATSQSGFFPATRVEFCAVAVSAPDGTSHNIYIYGGIEKNVDSPGGPSQDDIWVLTMPSFRWVKVGKSKVGKESITCSVVGQKYMFTYSGRVAQNFESCDAPGADGVLFDMTTLEWTDQYVAPNGTTQYQVPEKVYSLIGGSGTGNATELAPSEGFVDERLQTIFQAAITGGNSSKGSTSNTGPLSTGSAESSSNTPIGAIVGGVIGGVVALAVIIGLFIFWRRKKTPESKQPLEFTIPDGHGQYDEGMAMFTAPETPKYEMAAVSHPAEMAAAPVEPPTSKHRLMDER